MAIDINSLNVFDLFCQCTVFKDLEMSQIKEVINKTCLKEFKKGEYIFYAGKPCDFFYIVIKGLVKTYSCSLYGTKITYLLCREGESPNLIGPFTGESRLIEAMSIEDSF